MSSLYTASALLVLSLPHGFAAPLAQEISIVDVEDPLQPKYQLPNATVPPLVYASGLYMGTGLADPAGPLLTGVPIPGPTPEPLDVSSLTGGVITSPDLVDEPVLLDPGIGDGIIPDSAEATPLTFPIEPGIGDGTGPEAFGDPTTSDIASPTEDAMPIDIILSDAIPPATEVPYDSSVTDLPTPEIIKDPLLPPLDPVLSDPNVAGPPTLSLNKFVSIVQQLADVISNFFTVLPGQSIPVPIVDPDVASDLATAPTAAPFPLSNDTAFKHRKSSTQANSKMSDSMKARSQAESVSAFPILPKVLPDGDSEESTEGDSASIPENARHVIKAPLRSPHQRNFGRKDKTNLATADVVPPSIVDKFLLKNLPSIFSTLTNILPPSEVAKALKAAFNALSPASQAAVLLSLSLGPVLPDPKLTNPSQNNKRGSSPYLSHPDIKYFIEKWHNIGASLASLDPKLIDQLIQVFSDPEIDPRHYPNLGRYPELVRKFMLDYYILAQILVDQHVPSQDKADILKKLFDGSPGSTRKRDLMQRDDQPVWNLNKLKKFIQLFWQLDPRITSLDATSDANLFDPIRNDPSNTPPPYFDTNKLQGKTKQAVLLWNQFREFLASLPPKDRADLEAVLKQGQLRSGTTKRSMRHGLRHRQSEDGQRDSGVDLDDAQKLGSAALAQYLGPSGSLDPLGLSDADVVNFGKTSPGDDSASPSNDQSPSSDYGARPYDASEYDGMDTPTRPDGAPCSPTSPEYSGDYNDADDASDDFWDPYSQIDNNAGAYEDVPAGVPQNWVSDLRALADAIKLKAYRSD